MKTPQRRPGFYDVTTASREGKDQPPVIRPKLHSIGSILRAALAWGFRPFAVASGLVWLWVRKPIVLLFLMVIGGGLAVRVIALRSRPPAIVGLALPMAGWRMTGNPFVSSSRAVIKGNFQIQWTTRRGQSASNWFAVDMGKVQRFHQIVMDSGVDVDEYPRGYALYVSGDGTHWGSAVVRGAGTGPTTVVDLGPQSARYVKIVLTVQDGHNAWALNNFTVH